MSQTPILRASFALFLLITSGALIYGAWKATRQTAILVEWSTATELDVAGFQVLRSSSVEGPFETLNPDLLPPSDDPLAGGEYSYSDPGVQPGSTYYYMVEEIETSGTRSRYGPIEITASFDWVYIGTLSLVGLIQGGFFVYYVIQKPEKYRHESTSSS
jgi:hypothetical protein